MTKKHFQMIADILRNHGERLKALRMTLLYEKLCNEMADQLEQTNKLFDRKRFIEACGFDYCRHCEEYHTDGLMHVHNENI